MQRVVFIALVFLLIGNGDAQYYYSDYNPSCGLIVPPNPLTAQGLATPYQLVALDPSQGNCSMANLIQQAFVNAVILDTVSGAIFNYNPLVIDQGTEPAVAPVVPKLPLNFIVALFIGSNANAYGTPNDTLTLLSYSSMVDSLAQGNCLQGSLLGSDQDLFGQFSMCNAVQFFDSAETLINAGVLKVPPLGTAQDGAPCPSTRSFDLVDNTQSDTVPTNYLLTTDNKVAQYNSANLASLTNATIIDNVSDALLLSKMDAALGCSPWQIPDLTDPSSTSYVSGFATDELQANYYQAYPVAQVPALDPDVVEFVNAGNSQYDGQPSLVKLNAYRLGVGQNPISHLQQADVEFYCQGLATVGSHRFASAKPYWSAAPSPDPTSGSNLYTFLADRFIQTFGPGSDGFACSAVLGIPCPVSCTYDAATGQICINATSTPIDLLGVYSPVATPTPTKIPTTTVAPTSTSLSSSLPSSDTGNCNNNQSAVIGLAVMLGIVLAFGLGALVTWLILRQYPNNQKQLLQ